MTNGNYWKNMIGILAGVAAVWAIKKGQSRSDEQKDYVIDLQIQAVGRDAKTTDEDGANDAKNGCWRSGKGQIFDEDADNLVDCDDDDYGYDPDVFYDDDSFQNWDGFPQDFDLEDEWWWP